MMQPVEWYRVLQPVVGLAAMVPGDSIVVCRWCRVLPVAVLRYLREEWQLVARPPAFDPAPYLRDGLIIQRPIPPQYAALLGD
jgi:hypothetical protein